MAAGALGTVGTDAAPITVTATNAYEQLVALKVKLDEQNVPTAGRWVVVPAWYHGLLLLDSRFVANGTDKGVAMFEHGRRGGRSRDRRQDPRCGFLRDVRDRTRL